MSHELIAITMFASMLVLMLTGQRVFAAIGFVAASAAALLYGIGAIEMPFNAAFKLFNWYPLLTLPLFVYMGYILSETGIADDLYEAFHVWFGGLKGGLAVGTIGLMVVISAMNGLSVAGMAIGATIALPEMLKRGYDKVMITGVIQAGSSLGILVPPSVVLVLYGMIARQPVSQLWLAGAIPGLMMASLFIIYIIVRCKLQPELGPTIAEEERDKPLSEKLRLLRAGIIPFLIFFFMTGLFVMGFTSLVESSAVGATAATIAALVKRRDFLKTAGTTTVATAGAVAAGTLAAPYGYAATNPIKWRLQTYSGAPLGAHVIKPQIEAFNKAAHGQMEIELYYADQLVPTDELFRAMQNGTIDAVQSDDATMASPVDINVFGGYFPFSTRYSLDMPVLFKYYGLDQIWKEAYDEVDGVEWLSAGAWDPLHIFTKDPIRSLADMKGKRVFGVPTAGRFLSRYGLIPVTLPWDDIEVAIQTGELDGVAWCGFTEAYEVGWADVCNYALLNNVTGAWCGSYFANSDSWSKVPPNLQELFLMSCDQSHYYRQVWYWGGEAKLRVEGEKMELTEIPADEWNQVVKDAEEFWDDLASISPRTAKVVQAYKDYTAVMEKVGVPYRYG